MKQSNTLKQNEESIKSIMIILSYFMLPYLINFITKSNIISTLIYVMYFLILVLIYRNTFINDLKNLKKDSKKNIKTILLNILLIFVVTIIVNMLIEIIFKVQGTSENDYSLKNIFDKSPIILMLLTCIYYPIVEGIVFRKAVHDIIDRKWIFIIFSSLFYFFFNVVYTSMSYSAIMSSICYFTTMMILSYSYWKSNNFTLSVIVLIIYNLIFSLLNFL